MGETGHSSGPARGGTQTSAFPRDPGTLPPPRSAVVPSLHPWECVDVVLQRRVSRNGRARETRLRRPECRGCPRQPRAGKGAQREHAAQQCSESQPPTLACVRAHRWSGGRSPVCFLKCVRTETLAGPAPPGARFRNAPPPWVVNDNALRRRARLVVRNIKTNAWSPSLEGQSPLALVRTGG